MADFAHLPSKTAAKSTSAQSRSTQLKPHVPRPPWAPIQRRESVGAASAREPSGPDRAPNYAGLPDRLKDGLEAVSGLAMEDVRVHRNSPEPARLGALAYTRGSNIHLAPGQEQHLAHEAWHVVQQKQGRVTATTQMKERVPLNDDARLEAEADSFAANLASDATRTLTAPLLHRTCISAAAQRVVRHRGNDDPGLERESELISATASRSTAAGAAGEAAPLHRAVRPGAGSAAVVQRVVGERPGAEFGVSVAWARWFGAMTPEEVTEQGTALGLPRATLEALNKLLLSEGGEIDIPWDYADPVQDGPSSSPPLPTQQGTKQEISTQEESKQEELEPAPQQPTLTWSNFSKAYSIKSEASRFVQQVDKTITLEPGELPKPRSPVAYVANILTIPSGSVPTIITQYAKGGISPADYGSFAMVIGVNRYRSLDGASIPRVQEAAATATAVEAPFPCSVIPFVWDFYWGAPFLDVRQAFLKMSESDQARALTEEKSSLIQSIIPYGQLRERLTTHTTTITYVKRLRADHDAVYVHLGDDDAAAFPDFPLLEGYTERIVEKNFPPLVVGGYRFSTEEAGGDLNSENPGDVLTEIASQLDNLFRGVLSQVQPDLVYPTEPNLVFLASMGKDDFLEKMVKTTDKQDLLLRGSEEKKALEREGESFEGEPYFATGLPYGLGTNEGGKLRERIKEVRGSPKEGVTLYDSRLSVATASTRFNLGNEHKIDHKPSEGTYGFRRVEALRKEGEKGFLARIVEDALTIKQSHIGGLKKEILKTNRKDGAAIAADVLNAFRAIMLGEKPPKSLTPASRDYLKGINLRSDEIGKLRENVLAVAKNMLRAMPQSGEHGEQGL